MRIHIQIKSDSVLKSEGVFCKTTPESLKPFLDGSEKDQLQSRFLSFSLVPLRKIYQDLTFVALLDEIEEVEAHVLVQMDLPELGLIGPAVIIDLQEGPRIDPGPGRVVTAKFHHSSANVIDLTVGDTIEDVHGTRAEAVESRSNGTKSLGTTANHPFWSIDRQEFVQAGSLTVGEQLLTITGDAKRVTSTLPRPGPTDVYNIEVQDQHVYYVGENGLLVHNTYDRLRILRSFNGLKNTQRGLDALTEAHHPFFRMFRNAMDLSGMYPNVRGVTGRFRPQALDYMDPWRHRALHIDWNNFVVSKSLPELQTVRNNTISLVDSLKSRRVTPSEIFDLLDEFYMGSKHTTSKIWESLASYRSRLEY